jgi:hypothetical protein
MRILGIFIAFGWLFAFITSGSVENQKQNTIDSLITVNKIIINKLKKANDNIQIANEIIQDPSLVVRFNGVAVQVFRADTTHKK